MRFVNAQENCMVMNKIKIEVAYALPQDQVILVVEVDEGSTIEMVIKVSGILQRFPDIDLSKQKVGVFSQERGLSELVREGDRIEIYRPLVIDPKEARRQRGRR